jgi:hypothetical protein
MPDKTTTSDGRICPECQHRLYFGGTGRSLQCDNCGYRRSVLVERSHNLSYLAQNQTVIRGDDGQGGTTSARLLLNQGIAAVKAGDHDEAYHYLERVIITRATEYEQSHAWLWLSQVCADPADKRECLEQVLALDPGHGLARRGLALLEGRLQAEDIIDPDQLVQSVPAEPVMTGADIFRCYRCNGRMNYTPHNTALICEFCAYEQPLGEDGRPLKREERFGQGLWEQDFAATLAQTQGHVQPVAFRTFNCHNCAVNFVLPPETLSLTCPYCDAVYVTETAETHDLLPPQALLPFALSQEKAAAIWHRWFKKEKLTPLQLSPLVGLYLPVWTFDIGGEMGWQGLVQQGDNWVTVSGNRYIFHDDVLVPATQKLPPEFAHWLDDFDLTQLVAYDARYLADWPAERYQLPLANASLAARRQVWQGYRRQPHQLTQGEYVRDLRLRSNSVVVESYKLILLPVWIAHYRLAHDEATYDVLINGQNGVVRAERPEGMISRFWTWLRGGSDQ